jgi:hypothetical protein
VTDRDEAQRRKDQARPPDGQRADPAATASEGSAEDEHAADEQYLKDIGYEPGVNQLRHEPMPASDYADRDQEAVRRNEEANTASAHAAQAKGSRSPHTQVAPPDRR